MTLGNALAVAARRTPDATALICAGTRVSYEELDRTSSALAAWFLHRGLRRGDRVAIHCFNSLEAVYVLFACFKSGVIAVPINVRLKAPEVAYALTHSQSAMCFAQPELASVTEAAIAIAGTNIALETKLPPLDGSFEAHAATAAVGADDDAAILYTSGTTARPKGVTHTHASLLYCAGLTLSMLEDAGPVWMATTQMCHISGLVCMLLPSIVDGNTTLLLPAFDPGRALDLIERYRVTYTIGLPSMISALIEEQVRRPRDIGSLRAFLGGGDTVSVLLQERFTAMTGVPILELIGMTESCPISWNTANDLRPGSVGKPRQGVEVTIAALDGASGDGELRVRSRGNFRGYWHDPEATAAVLRDGWIHSGDLVREDADGYLWFRGRLKQLIVRGGSNISPQEVEEALLQHPAVLEAGVIGLPDSTYGQKVGAFLVLREEMTVSDEELRAFAGARLADYKVPSDLWFLPELPKGITGKVDRRALTDTALSRLRSSTAAGAN